ncbi:MAG: CHRD domain-containing protein [Chthoniobacterales bacterium]
MRADSLERARSSPWPGKERHYEKTIVSPSPRCRDRVAYRYCARSGLYRLSGGPNENPANDSTGTGFVRITLDFDLFTMRVEAEFANLVGMTTAAHIHAATATPLSGNAGVATQTPSFEAFPNAVTSATYDHTFDLADASSYNPNFIAANGGTVSTASNALFAALDQRKAYLNIHTTAFPGGEIRAFLVEPRGVIEISRLGGNTIHLECLGRPELMNRIESSPDLQDAHFTTLATIMAEEDGTFEFNDTNAGTKKFYRVKFP